MWSTLPWLITRKSCNVSHTRGDSDMGCWASLRYSNLGRVFSGGCGIEENFGWAAIPVISELRRIWKLDVLLAEMPYEHAKWTYCFDTRKITDPVRLFLIVRLTIPVESPTTRDRHPQRPKETLATLVDDRKSRSRCWKSYAGIKGFGNRCATLGRPFGLQYVIRRWAQFRGEQD